MDQFTTIGILISAIALLVSIATYRANKAVTNQVQLQNVYLAFCEKLQILLDLGRENTLVAFKYDFENYTFRDLASMESKREYNELKKKIDLQRESCKKIYSELIEEMDIFLVYTPLSLFSKANQFGKWLNNTLNQYFLKLISYYDGLLDFSDVMYYAQHGETATNEKEVVENFYKNILEILQINQALQTVKREMVGKFKALSVRDVGFFKDNVSCILSIKKQLYSFVEEFEIDKAINGEDCSKIQAKYLDFGKGNCEFVKQAKQESIMFLALLRNNFHNKDFAPRYK